MQTSRRCLPSTLILVAAVIMPTGSTAVAATDCAQWNRSLHVVGVPFLDGGRGAVEVSSSNGRVLLTRASLGMGEADPGDRFGASLTLTDHFDDSCSTLVVGAPGAHGSGVVYVLRGSPSGFQQAYAVRLPQPQSGDRFGSSVTTAGSEVWAGAPGRDVSGQSDAGAVGRFTAGERGPERLREFTQNSPGVAGAAEAGDRFGEVLSQPGTRNDGTDEESPDWSTPVVIVGVPREDVGSARDAGMILELVDDPALTGGGRGWTQNTEDVPGRVEAGDLFGAALSSGRSLRVGAPGEDVGSTKDAGSVTLFGQDGSGPPSPQYAITQESRRVPGSAEAGDRFGSSITSVDNFCSKGATDGIAIGAPGEDIDSRTDAGGVVLFDTGIFSDEGIFVVPNCRSVWVQQGGRAPGHLEPGDRFGTQVATTGSGDLAISAPGEDRVRNSLRDAGVVDLVALPEARPLREQTLITGAKANLRYAQLLSE
jgi:hypothetical protein